MNSLFETLRSLGVIRLATMAVVAAAVLAFFVFLTSRLATPDMALLYGDLDPQDSGRIVARLEQLHVPVEIGLGGNQIYVPADQVARLRLVMAEEGLPAGGSIGYEIFDRSEGLGTTSFVQSINHLRALEGELARTIRSIAQVKQARVHLVLPRRELFSRDRQEPSASIILLMRGNTRMAQPQIRAIQHLVAAAVPGLQPSMVSIVDDKGTLLARTASEEDLQGTARTAEEMRLAYENQLARTVEELLERSVGLGNVRAEVSAEMDFDRVTENSEIYDPDSQVVRSTQVVEETSNSQDEQETNAVTVGNNLPGADLPSIGGPTSASNTSRTEETVNFEISRTVKTHVREIGVVRRLSVAVLVNGHVDHAPTGEPTYEPRSPEEMEKLAALVRSAVGFDESRGDALEIVNMRFADVEPNVTSADDTGLFGFAREELLRLSELLVLGVVAVLILLLVVRPLLMRILDSSADSQAAQTRLLSHQQQARAALVAPGGSVPAVAEPGAPHPSPDDPGTADDKRDLMIDLNKVEGRVRVSSIRKVGEIVDRHPEEAVAIVRNWLYQDS